MLLTNMIDIPFDFTSLLMYLSGILTGIILSVLIYILLVLLSINKSKKIIEAENISEEDVREMIKISQENYKLLRKSKDPKVKESAYKEIILTLINDIATKCFPNSKRPMLELSIDESLLLAKYIIQRVEELLNKKGLSLIKRISISKISDVIIAKRKVDNNVVVKEVKKYSKIAKVGMTVANVLLSPVKLIKSGAKITKNFIVSKIMLVTISIIGEETYKIYTKQAIKSMDPEYIKLLESLEEDEEDSLEEITQEN